MKALQLPDDVVRDTGLGYLNRNDRQTDAFRGRILFPIFDANGDAVGFGGRVMPGGEGPKYKNTPETVLYQKSKLLYALNWSKARIVNDDRAIVCEGYTDVIGFARAGRAGGRRHVRHRAHRGAREAAAALRPQARAGLRRRLGRPGRRRALLPVGEGARPRGHGGRPAAGRRPGRPGVHRPRAARRRRSRRRCRSSSSGSTGCSRRRRPRPPPRAVPGPPRRPSR